MKRIHANPWVLALGLVVGGLTSAANAQLYANSAADFSGVQGRDGWYYGYYAGTSANPYTPADFTLLPIFDGEWHRELGAGGYWTRLNDLGGHPNGLITSAGRVEEDNWAVRRWVSPVSSLVRITGDLWDRDPHVSGTGVTGHIFMKGAEVWTGSVAPGDTTGIGFTIVACVSVGDVIDFAIDPLDHNDWDDDTGFVATIHSVIEEQPQSVVICPDGTASFSVTCYDDINYSYQWWHNGSAIPDATSSRYIIEGAGLRDVGWYVCLVSVDGCMVLSNYAFLDICQADFNCDGVVNSNDFFDFLAQYFIDGPTADVNHDGMINSQDFFDFLTMFFSGCRN